MMKVVSENKENKEVTCYVRKPNAQDNQNAKLYANTIASKILLRKDENGKPNFITRQQVRQILKDSGRLTEQDEQKITDLSKEIKTLEDILIKGGIKKSEGREVALKLGDKRGDLLLLLLSINELDEHTLESEVENANFDYLVYSCTTFEDGKSVFTSVDDYRNKSEEEPYCYEAARALKEMLYGTTEDMLRNNIENKFLAKYKYIDEKLRLVDEQGRLVNRENELINEEGRRISEDGAVLNERKLELGEFAEDETVDVQPKDWIGTTVSKVENADTLESETKEPVEV